MALWKMSSCCRRSFHEKQAHSFLDYRFGLCSWKLFQSKQSAWVSLTTSLCLLNYYGLVGALLSWVDIIWCPSICIPCACPIAHSGAIYDPLCPLKHRSLYRAALHSPGIMWSLWPITWSWITLAIGCWTASRLPLKTMSLKQAASPRLLLSLPS